MFQRPLRGVLIAAMLLFLLVVALLAALPPSLHLREVSLTSPLKRQIDFISAPDALTIFTASANRMPACSFFAAAA